MPGLGETTAMLARFRKKPVSAAAGRGHRQLRELSPPDANPGDLKMLSYLPPALAKGAPLVVLLHGCTQTAEAYATGAGWIELADRLGFAILAPEQIAANNINRCFNWFVDGDVQRGQGEAASIAQMVVAMVKAHGLDPNAVFITGLSAGGAMTAVMLATYPEMFAGGAIVAGLPYGVANGVPDAMLTMFGGTALDAEQLGDLVRKAAPLRAKPVRISIWHGDADTTVVSSNAQALVAQWTNAYHLPTQATSVDQLGTYSRSRWETGEETGAVVELNMVHGLGHGTPISTQVSDGVGVPSPFILEAGVSSSTEVAAFWGLGGMQNSAQADVVGARDSADDRGRRTGPMASVMDAIEGRVPETVKGLIERTLRSAGLGR